MHAYKYYKHSLAKKKKICDLVLGLHGKVLQQGSYKGGFYDQLLEDFPMSNEANAGQFQDGPGAVSDSGNTSGITYLRRGKRCCTAASVGRDKSESM